MSPTSSVWPNRSVSISQLSVGRATKATPISGRVDSMMCHTLPADDGEFAQRCGLLQSGEIHIVIELNSRKASLDCVSSV